ncbi:coiled-coil domain-containing protein 169 isoform X2 [Zonotrichia albicollis]|uniref:coiled-coil domain-containing protein 169 isoform X2 n=1 Tax=Zonotrichia albicollis TaxID=44394 RepID=UPI003D80E96B
MLGISLDRGQDRTSNAGRHSSGGRALLQTRADGTGQVPAVAPDPVSSLGFFWAAGEPRGVRSKKCPSRGWGGLSAPLPRAPGCSQPSPRATPATRGCGGTGAGGNGGRRRPAGGRAGALGAGAGAGEAEAGFLKEVLKQLEEEKKILQNQLKDYELRLEQETKTSAKPKIFERKKPDALTGKGGKQILRGRHSVPGNLKMVNPQVNDQLKRL